MTCWYWTKSDSFHRYASEGIKAACDWAYKGVSEGSVLDGKQEILVWLAVSACFFAIWSMRNNKTTCLQMTISYPVYQ